MIIIFRSDSVLLLRMISPSQPLVVNLSALKLSSWILMLLSVYTNYGQLFECLVLFVLSLLWKLKVNLIGRK